MVILKLTKPVSSEFECEAPIIGNKDSLLVRPCERYIQMYKSCKSIRGRIHQYYVYGELLDCSHHSANYQACLKFRKTKDFDDLKGVIEWEKNMMETRLQAERQNNTWTLRDKPPEDFNTPLPEFLAKRQAQSSFNGTP